MIDETESVTLALYRAPHRFNRQGLHLRQLFVGDARATFFLQHVHQRRPGVALRAQARRNLNLRLRFEMKRCDGTESDREERDDDDCSSRSKHTLMDSLIA